MSGVKRAMARVKSYCSSHFNSVFTMLGYKSAIAHFCAEVCTHCFRNEIASPINVSMLSLFSVALPTS